MFKLTEGHAEDHIIHYYVTHRIIKRERLELLELIITGNINQIAIDSQLRRTGRHQRQS